LERLDEIVDEHFSALRQERDRQLDVEINSEIEEEVIKGFVKREKAGEAREDRKKIRQGSWRWRKEKRSLRISLSRGREVHVERFAEAISHSPSQDEIPLGFLFHLEVHPVEVVVDVNGPWGNELTIRVTPNDLEASQEIFGTLVNWANDVEPPRWQQKWFSWSGGAAFLLVLLLAFGVVLIPLASWGTGATQTTKEEARKLLAQGINASNQQRALELLLALQADYSPPGTPKHGLGIRYWSYVLLGGSFLLVASISPSQALGFWKGRVQLQRWRWWISSVSVTLPTIAITFLILPWLLYLLRLTPPSP